MPTGNTAQRPGSPAAGYFRYNSETAKFEGYTSEWGSIAGGGSGTNMDTNIFAGDGSDTTFTLSTAPDTENNLMVFVDGVFQAQCLLSIRNYINLCTAPANGRVITVYHSTTTVGGSNNTINTMTGDNSDTTLTLSVAPVHENNVQVYFDGVYQSKANYAISGTTLTFSTAPATGVLVEAITNTNTSSTTANQLLDADGDTMIQVEESSDEDKIRFDTGGTERLVLDSTGLTSTVDITGIGIKGIESNNGDPVLGHFYNDNTGTATEATVYVTNSSTTSDGLFLQTTGTAFTTVGGFVQDAAVLGSGTGSSGGLSIMTRANADIRFYTNGHTNERMRIDSSGNVGIGTTSPQTKLHVAGTVRFSTTSGDGTETRHSFTMGGAADPGIYQIANGAQDTKVQLHAAGDSFFGGW